MDTRFSDVVNVYSSFYLQNRWRWVDLGKNQFNTPVWVHFFLICLPGRNFFYSAHATSEMIKRHVYTIGKIWQHWKVATFLLEGNEKLGMTYTTKFLGFLWSHRKSSFSIIAWNFWKNRETQANAVGFVSGFCHNLVIAVSHETPC